ncbi:phenylacetate--CoA ligase family protein [Pseudoalteromonas issachenkonii]|uniref:Phenylacetate--CoA ligase family protein n=1 Tax=Pseudoalteromonas issachenkonii TaxID=152297 RepID=A0ABU9GYC3_9GAMM
MFNSKLYQSSPVFIQNIMLSTRALIRKKMRENKKCNELTNTLITHEYDADALNKYTKAALSHVIKEATKNVSFYKSEFSQITDFHYIDKAIVNKHKKEFLSSKKSGLVIQGATSGTTGTPLSIPQNMESVITEQAFVNRMMTWADLEPGDKKAWIRGDMIVPLEQKKPPFWRYSYFEDTIILSSFHMLQKNLDGYIKAIYDFNVQVIQAYPSSIVALAKHLESHNKYYLGDLKAIITSSESLTQEDKALVEKRFKCTVFDWYGLFERVAAIGSCEHGRYHILTDYSHVELLDVGEGRHEIVGTNFNNELYPLVRYRTGDHVYLSDEESCPCGRVFPIIDRIEGRVGDYLVGEDGQKIHILNHIPKGVEGLLATQFIQSSHHEIKVLVVVTPSLFTEAQQEKLINNTKKRLGKSIAVSVEIIDAIPRTKNGKVRQAICSI